MRRRQYFSEVFERFFGGSIERCVKDVLVNIDAIACCQIVLYLHRAAMLVTGTTTTLGTRV